MSMDPWTEESLHFPSEQLFSSPEPKALGELIV